jgi:hypothetical protein
MMMMDCVVGVKLRCKFFLHETFQSTSAPQLSVEVAVVAVVVHQLVLVGCVPDEVNFRLLLSGWSWSGDLHVILGLSLLQEDVDEVLVLVLLRLNELRLRGRVLAWSPPGTRITLFSTLADSSGAEVTVTCNQQFSKAIVQFVGLGAKVQIGESETVLSCSYVC